MYDFSGLDVDAYRTEKLSTFVALLKHLILCRNPHTIKINLPCVDYAQTVFKIFMAKVGGNVSCTGRPGGSERDSRG